MPVVGLRRVRLQLLLIVFFTMGILSAGLRAGEPPRWTLRESGTRQALSSITGNGTLFVVVGRAGTVLTSPDAITWSTQVSPTQQDLNGVVWFHGAFVAVGNNGLILTSRDGVAWTPEISHTTASLNDIAASDTSLVAVGDRGTILTSANGSRWVAPTTPDFTPKTKNTFVPSFDSGRIGLATSRLPDLYHIVHTPHEFIIASGHNIVTSTEGLVWTAVGVIPIQFNRGGTQTARGVGAGQRGRAGGRGLSSIPPDSLNSAALRDDLTIAVGNSGQFWSSSKSGTWTHLKLPFANHSAEQWNAIEWSGRHFVVVGGNGTILTSVDGEDWQNPFSPTKNSLLALYSQPGLWVAVGDNGAIVTNDDLPVIAKPTISPDGGLFTSRPTVTLSSATPGVTFHYTLNGGDPDEQSATYGQPFLMPGPGNLRVRAYKDGMDVSLETEAIFKMPVVPTIVEEPRSLRVPWPPPPPLPGEPPTTTLRFVVQSSGAIPAATTFQWQIKHPGKDSWDDLSNHNTDADGDQAFQYVYDKSKHGWVSEKTLIDKKDPDIQTSALNVEYDPSMEGDRFRCVVSNEAGQSISTDAGITFYPAVPAEIDKEPTDAVVRVGETANFTVTAKGDPAPTYLWLRRPNPIPQPPPDPFGLQHGGVIYDAFPIPDANEVPSSPYSGTHSPTLTVRNTTLKMSGDAFICIVFNRFEIHDVYTPWVNLQVWNPPPLITRQPLPVDALPGSIVTFRVEVDLRFPWCKFQWEYRTPQLGDWEPLKDGDLYSGTQDNSLDLHVASLPMSGYQYRCIVDDAVDQIHEVSVPVVLTIKK